MPLVAGYEEVDGYPVVGSVVGGMPVVAGYEEVDGPVVDG
jgi:hypothetical protein